MKLRMILLCKGTYAPVMHPRSGVPEQKPEITDQNTEKITCQYGQSC